MSLFLWYDLRGETPMQLPDFLELDADNEVRIHGHRIRLIDIAARYAEGHSPETILLDHYPTLSLPIIHKTIAFYLEHQSEVDALIAENASAMVELESKTARIGPAVDELRRRMINKAPRAEAQ
jgi:uncharacterized protein (DUF433 family)